MENAQRNLISGPAFPEVGVSLGWREAREGLGSQEGGPGWDLLEVTHSPILGGIPLLFCANNSKLNQHRLYPSTFPVLRMGWKRGVYFTRRFCNGSRPQLGGKGGHRCPLLPPKKSGVDLRGQEPGNVGKATSATLLTPLSWWQWFVGTPRLKDAPVLM